MTVVGGQPKKKRSLPVIKQRNTTNVLLQSLIITGYTCHRICPRLT